MATGHITKKEINVCRNRLIHFSINQYEQACYSRRYIFAEHFHGYLKTVLVGLDFYFERPRAFHVVKHQAGLLTDSFQKVSKYVVGVLSIKPVSIVKITAKSKK